MGQAGGAAWAELVGRAPRTVRLLHVIVRVLSERRRCLSYWSARPSPGAVGRPQGRNRRGGGVSGIRARPSGASLASRTAGRCGAGLAGFPRWRSASPRSGGRITNGRDGARFARVARCCAPGVRMGGLAHKAGSWRRACSASGELRGLRPRRSARSPAGSLRCGRRRSGAVGGATRRSGTHLCGGGARVCRPLRSRSRC